MAQAAQVRRRFNLQYLRERLEVWDSWQSPPTFPGVPNGDELARQYVALVRKIVEEDRIISMRIDKLNHNEHAKRRIQAGRLLKRLQAHKQDRIKMSSAQILAAKIVIGTVIPISQRTDTQEGED